eukprot:s5931_g1.t1
MDLHQRRRKATPEELAEGEAQMKQAQEKLDQQVREGEEKPLEDGTVRERGTGEGERVSQPPSEHPPVTPLFTPEQARALHMIHDSAPWMIPGHRTVYTPYVTRPQFLDRDEERLQEEMVARERQYMLMRREQEEREEVRRSLAVLMEENRQLKMRLQEVEMRGVEVGEPKFSTPQSEGKEAVQFQSKEAETTRKEAVRPPLEVPRFGSKEAETPIKEAERPPAGATDAPSKEAETPRKEADRPPTATEEIPPREAETPNKEAERPPAGANGAHQGDNRGAASESSGNAAFTEKSWKR